MKIKTSPAEVWQEYEAGVAYNTSIELYDNVENNENFYTGKHWEGINAPDLDKIAMPLVSNIVQHFVAMVAVNNVAVCVADGGPDGERISDRVNAELSSIFESEKFMSKVRQLVRNGAVDGDYCLHAWIDADEPTGRKAGGEDIRGVIHLDIMDNTMVLFGNPHESEVQPQPYIILPMREYTDDVREEARRNGVTQADVDLIMPDADPNEYNSRYDAGNLTTTLLKYWRDRKTGTIRAVKTTHDVVIRKPWDTEYSLYPIAYACWEPVKNSYHGVAAVTEIIPTQIFINKIYAMAMYYVKRMTFPKVAYDRTKLPNGWNNKLNEAIAVVGDPNQAIIKAVVAPEMSNQVFVMIDKVIEHTKEFKGATDVLFGNVRPDNTSAIIALTKAAAVPLEMKKQALYQFVEDIVRVVLDIMATDYGTRFYPATDEAVNPGSVGEQRPQGATSPTEQPFDYAALKRKDLRLKVDVGESSYWSEVAQAQTMDNLFMKGLIDAAEYVEGIPDGYVRHKNKILESMRAREQPSPPTPLPQNGLGEGAEAPPTQAGGGMPPQLAQLAALGAMAGGGGQ